MHANKADFVAAAFLTVTSWPCLAQGQVARRHDVYLALDSPLSLVDLSLGDAESELNPVVTSLSFSTNDPYCNTDGCAFTLNQLSVRFENFTGTARVEGEPAQFSIVNPTVLIEGPLVLTRSLGKLIVPKGARRGCQCVRQWWHGRPRHHPRYAAQ